MENWQERRTMSGKEFVRVRKRLKLTQAGAARYLGFSERKSRRVVLDQAKLEDAQVLLLRALVYFKVKPEVPVWVSPRTGKPGKR